MSLSIQAACLTLFLSLTLIGPSVSAQPARAAAPAESGGPAWASLGPAQRQALAPLERDWHTIDGPRKAKWLEIAARFPAMPADERQRVQARMAEWARLTPTERGRARLTFQESKQFTREQKQERWEAYQALPEEKRQALAARAKPADGQARASAAPLAALDAAVPKQTAALPRAGASAPAVKPVAPTIVQAKPGATTTLMTRPPAPPSHQRPGQPKIAAKPDQVDRNTMLPQRGPQAAASAPRRP